MILIIFLLSNLLFLELAALLRSKHESLLVLDHAEEIQKGFAQINRHYLGLSLLSLG